VVSSGSDKAPPPAVAMPDPRPAGQPSFSVAANSGSWTLQVAPPGLGPVHVRLDLHGGSLDTRFLVADPGAKSALESGLAALRASLSGHGVNVGQLDVGLSHAGGRGGPYQQGPPRERRQPAPDPVPGRPPGRPRRSGALNLLG
jgi:hypothetical protein